MSPFFITGLPRSRTAWLSVAATSAHSICHHEPGHGDLESAADIWRTPSRYRLVGIADAGLGVHLQQVLDQFKPRTLIIERPIHEVLASGARYLGGHVDAGWEERTRVQLAILQQALKAQSPLIRRIAFAELEDVAVVRKALAWLGVLEPLNLDDLMKLNVQSRMDHNLAKLRSFRAAAA